ncbi:uncharacterized protein LOC122373978 isoform X2 [Amphibalanus amphitrite]|uniref:uncharacterized protein LOC122373978 isoform X2 n=1 Tax=Amphibalanus amphitrite TaxID=1232801 RepID=UPI001C9176EF|nr:uncharacterized protein LOC122373978 isoform X2 [Amphibalanus amphitrite]XP_043208392.1 uncharacterized protein LOC122373978 isoform X2 [Amphibalanus amphitrite]XP_043208393.1 uncharacterized protein LOC122373978 isoform X2 [Amphibalanus amphitrite]XP_043208394.1 uncharacterized protein LOC122373978 isoform X2 [Amphibalanus amphitrite]XP_043208395.1 uncharacterized protein LOC122373978 isoform X2 [Amphibalanus amphitrite]
MDTAARISALTADSPPEEVSAVLSTAASAAETASESEGPALTTALADALLALPVSVSTTGAGQHLCRLTAELAKREENRSRLSVSSLLRRLVEVLAAAAEPKEDVDDLVQPCRALGNLCYEGEPARAGLLEPPGPVALTAAVLKATTAGKEGARAREVASGLVLNFINDYPAGVDWAVDSESLNRLIVACCDDVTQSSLVRHTLVAAAVVVDSPRREALLGSRLAALLAVCLLPQREPSVLEEALETAAAWCRHDEARLALAHGGVADSLVCLLPAANCPAEARALLVELLSGDQAMAAVYRRGEGAVYKEVRRWLAEGGAAETLTACACDALSNFATNDDHATGMVRSGVHLDLVPPLKSDSARLQMAALSLLRNLCLPSANKVALLEAGTLDHLLSLSVVEQPALFKYYGTLRLLVADSGAACGRLANHPGLLEQVVAAARGDGPYGVQHEACRLLARLVRTAQSSDVSRAVVSAGGHSSLVRLLRADNAVMTNEAIMALCHTAPLTEAAEIVSSELADAMTAVMNNTEFPFQVKENAATLLILLRSREPEVAEALSGVPQLDPASAVDR